MNTQKIQSIAASIYRREFTKSQFKTHSYHEPQNPEKGPTHPNADEFESELAKALEGITSQSMKSIQYPS